MRPLPLGEAGNPQNGLIKFALKEKSPDKEIKPNSSPGTMPGLTGACAHVSICP